MSSDVHTSDAPAPRLVSVDLKEVNSRVLIGSKAGSEVRKLFNLDDVDADPSAVAFVQIPDYTCVVSDSFFRGMFEGSIRAAGSHDAFMQKFRFSMDEKFAFDLEEVIMYVLLVKSSADVPAT